MVDITYRRLIEDDLSLFKKWLYQPYVARFFGDLNEWVAEVEANYRGSDWVKYFIASVGEPMEFVQFYDRRRVGARSGCLRRTDLSRSSSPVFID